MNTSQNDKIENLQAEDKTALSEVAVFVENDQRSGTFVLKNSSTICGHSQQEGIELLPIAAALKKYNWLEEKYFWKQISKDKSEITRACASSKTPLGYFIMVKKGHKVTLPTQAALYMAKADEKQIIHNIVILEEDSELELITGCVTKQGIDKGEHIAVSETFIGKNAKFTNTMVHSWGSEVEVKPHSVTVVEEGGSFVSNYVSLRPAGKIVSNPVTHLNGAGASAKYFSIILGSGSSEIDLGGDVYLNAKGTSAEIAHRAVCTGGKIIQRGMLIGKEECHAHVDCSGMLIDPGEEGFIESIPGVKAYHEDARMSHEASIGKIAPSEVQYLMTHGMKEKEAISMIIRGFLDSDIKGLGPELDKRIAEIAELAGHGSE